MDQAVEHVTAGSIDGHIYPCLSVTKYVNMFVQHRIDEKFYSFLFIGECYA